MGGAAATLLRVACPWQLREWVALPQLHRPPAAHGVDGSDWLDSVALRSPLELLHEGAPHSRAAPPSRAPPSRAPRRTPAPRRAPSHMGSYPDHAVPLLPLAPLAASRWLVARPPNREASCRWNTRPGDYCMCAAAASPTHRTRSSHFPRRRV